MEPSEHEPYDLWWKSAIIYCLDVETFFDSNGDGFGDFDGLTQRLDHLSGLGVNCLWLMPFYPTPNRDDGYDVMDYFSIDPRLGDLGDFTMFVQAARQRGMRVIADLVVNHTSDEHPWFQAARDPESPFHDFYVWQDERPEGWDTGLIFPGEQKENWTYDRKAKRYYLHNFYRHQPDLNPDNPAVRRKLKQTLAFWSQQDLAGFRVDAVPFLIELDGITGQIGITPHGFLQDLARFLRRRDGNSILLGEVNLHPREQREFFGDGDELQMVFSFYVNQYLYLALARGQADPLRKALETLPSIPSNCQWANFLTNHDELNLDKLTSAERSEVFEAFGPDPDVQLYGRGLRLRLPTMLDGDERRLRMAYSLMFGLPGTPVLFYGEEIGMRENLEVPGRRSVRTPMQWKPQPGGGFSIAAEEDFARPMPTGPGGPQHINVAEQMRDPTSMLSWMQRLIRRRRETPELGMGEWKVIDVGAPEVLAVLFTWGTRSVVTAANLSDRAVRIDVGAHQGDCDAVDIWSDDDTAELSDGSFDVGPYGYRWIRLRRPDDGLLL